MKIRFVIRSLNWSLCLSYVTPSFTIIMQLICCYSQDKIGSWYSNPVTGTVESGSAGGGGVGKYLKARSALPESAAVNAGSTELASTKKRKLGVSATNYNNFSSW